MGQPAGRPVEAQPGDAERDPPDVRRAALAERAADAPVLHVELVAGHVRRPVGGGRELVADAPRVAVADGRGDLRDLRLGPGPPEVARRDDAQAVAADRVLRPVVGEVDRAEVRAGGVGVDRDVLHPAEPAARVVRDVGEVPGRALVVAVAHAEVVVVRLADHRRVPQPRRAARRARAPGDHRVTAAAPRVAGRRAPRLAAVVADPDDGVALLARTGGVDHGEPQGVVRVGRHDRLAAAVGEARGPGAHPVLAEHRPDPRFRAAHRLGDGRGRDHRGRQVPADGEHCGDDDPGCLMHRTPWARWRAIASPPLCPHPVCPTGSGCGRVQSYRGALATRTARHRDH